MRIRAILSTSRKYALNRDETSVLYNTVISHYSNSTIHDDLLFVAQLLVGFFALMRLSELTNSDTTKFYNTLKITRRSSILIRMNAFNFFAWPQSRQNF